MFNLSSDFFIMLSLCVYYDLYGLNRPLGSVHWVNRSMNILDDPFELNDKSISDQLFRRSHLIKEKSPNFEIYIFLWWKHFNEIFRFKCYSWPLSSYCVQILFNTTTVDWNQCDQIGRFIGLWAIFQSLWQQLNCPNLPHS